jgi:hypothetical protein
MFIDYIYLLLIIIVICFIVFLIYLSYEYRSIECFVSPVLKPLSNIKYNTYNVNEYNNNFDVSYKNLITEIYNRDTSRDNIKNIELYEKINKNVIDTENLKALQNKLTPEQKQFPIDKLIKTIKSKYNSQYISTFSNDMKKYGILANDKCLTVNGLCKEEFCLLDCQNNLYSSDSQKFSTNRINSASDAATFMNVSVNKISNKNIYPFNIFKSFVNDNCLTISNDGITVENCNLNNIKQQWEISPDDNLCVLK